MSADKHPADPWTRPRTLLESVLADGLSAHREAIHEALRRIPALEAELERETIRLAACGLVAMSDTPESAARNRQMHPDYESASCRDVARRVDECMALRAERDQLRAEVQALRGANSTFATAAILPDDKLIVDKAEVEALRADADRLDFIAKRARSDPKMDGQHVWWPTTFNNALRGPTLRDAIDAARKQQ